MGREWYVGSLSLSLNFLTITFVAIKSFFSYNKIMLISYVIYDFDMKRYDACSFTVENPDPTIFRLIICTRADKHSGMHMDHYQSIMFKGIEDV